MKEIRHYILIWKEIKLTICDEHCIFFFSNKKLEFSLGEHFFHSNFNGNCKSWYD